MEPRRPRVPWRLLAAESVGTASLILMGLSLVILMFGDGSPAVAATPEEGPRRAITGFLFGTTDARGVSQGGRTVPRT